MDAAGVLTTWLQLPEPVSTMLNCSTHDHYPKKITVVAFRTENNMVQYQPVSNCCLWLCDKCASMGGERISHGNTNCQNRLIHRAKHKTGRFIVEFGIVTRKVQD